VEGAKKRGSAAYRKMETGEGGLWEHRPHEANVVSLGWGQKAH